jgi:uncharacterized circularly permuted ATP-grasp superfamily protein
MVRAPNAKGEGEYYVLEDNSRAKRRQLRKTADDDALVSGVAHLHRVAPGCSLPRPVADAASQQPAHNGREPTVVVLTPGAQQRLL